MKKAVKVKAISLVLSLALVLSLVTAVSLMTQAQEVEVVKSGETKMFYPTSDGYKFGDGTIFLSGSTIQASSGGLAMHVYIDNELVYESPNSSNYTFEQDCQSNSQVVYYSPYVPGPNGESGCVIYFDSYTDPTKKAVIKTDFMAWGSDFINIEGINGQEYIIVPKGTEITEKDWENSVLPDPACDDYVNFDNLEPATEYDIYTRVAATQTDKAGEPAKITLNTDIDSIASYCENTIVGTTVEIEPDPDKDSFTYKWYQNEESEDNEGRVIHNLTEIPGETGKTYTFRSEDIGKYITVKIFLGDIELDDWTTMDPVIAGATVYFESNGGSDVETITGVKSGAKITKPEDPEKEGFVFAGWFWEEEFETEFDFDNDTITWNETTLYAKWEPVSYNIISVKGLSGKAEKEWTKGGKAGVVITVKNNGEEDSFDHFVGVKLDGKELVKDKDYTVEKGSTIVTLKPETLENLDLGEHTVTVLFDNGEVNTTLTVLAANSQGATSPQTGDNSHFGLWIALMMFSLLGIAATLLYGRKKRVFGK